MSYEKIEDGMLVVLLKLCRSIRGSDRNVGAQGDHGHNRADYIPVLAYWMDWRISHSFQSVLRLVSFESQGTGYEYFHVCIIKRTSLLIRPFLTVKI